jgi:hypothetical protein
MDEDLVTAEALAERAGVPLSTIAAYAKGGLIRTHEDYHGRKRFKMVEALEQLAWAKAQGIDPTKINGRWRPQIALREPDGMLKRRRKRKST